MQRMECRELSCGGAKGHRAKIRQNHRLAGFRVATFRPAMQRYDKQGQKDERSPRENPPNGDFFVFSHGHLSTRQAKKRQTGGEKATHEKCRTFVWRGERSPCENTKKPKFGEFSRGDLSRFRGETAKGRHVKTRQIVIFTIWRVYAWRLFAFSPGGAKSRHAKSRKSHHLAGFCVQSTLFSSYINTNIVMSRDRYTETE